MGVAVTIYWQEPEEGSWTVFVDDLSVDEMRNIQQEAKKMAEDEWGITIPSIRIHEGLTKKGHRSQVDAKDFASAIRYDTGEDIYPRDIPEFKSRGIERS